MPPLCIAHISQSPSFEEDSGVLEVKKKLNCVPIMLRLKNEIGSIEAGKDADFVVLSEDLFETDPYALHKTKPEAVVMEGELISGALR